MTPRVLPREEYPRLAGTELEQVWPFLPPGDSEVLVIEHDGAIVGCWAAIRYVHVEGVWIRPDHRKRGRVAWHLVKAMRRMVAAMGSQVALTSATTDDVRKLILHLDGRLLPGQLFVLPMGDL